MKRSSDLEIGGSGDRKGEFTAETRRRGENQKPTTEVRRYREDHKEVLEIDFSDHPITCDHPITRSPYLCHPERVGADATASRRTPTMPVPERAASGSSHETANLTAETRRRGENQKPTTEARRHREESGDRVIARDLHPAKPKSGSAGTPLDRVIGKTKAFFSTVRGVLHEIFDESAYDRFLLRTHASRSIASYRDFTQERDVAMQRKPRCC